MGKQIHRPASSSTKKVEKKVDIKKEKKRKINKPMVILSIINFLFTLLLIFYVIKLNVIPMKYFLFSFLLLFLVDTFALLLLQKKKKAFKIAGYVISFIFMIINTVGIYYIAKTNDFLNKSFGNAESYHVNTYYVVTNSDSSYTELADIKGEKIGYYETIPNIVEALEELNKTIDTENILYDNMTSTFDALGKKSIDAIVIEKSLYGFITEYDNSVNSDTYRVLDSFDIKIYEEEEDINRDNEYINIYIGGVDFTELYTDFNMLVTINKKTHKILLTSTPRDYYVELDGKGGARDLLGYAGVWGVNTSRKTLGNLYNTNIDYYVKINTKSLVGLVDTLGGIEFCSHKSFYTTHALVMGTYDDTRGKKLYVGTGCKNYNGIQTLTIARERKAYPDGDRQRQKNCQAIMISIFNKMLRPENLTNYANILGAVSDLYTTNIPRDLVTEFARDTIDNGANWTFEQQSVTGLDSRNYVHLSNLQDYVMIPDEESVATASAKIKEVEAGN